MDKLIQFKLSVEEQIERYKNNNNITLEHKVEVLDKLDFVLERIKIFEFDNELNKK